MLSNYSKGYAVMDPDLGSYYIQDEYLHVCKEYCRPGLVICERIPKTCGINITINILPFDKKYPFYFHRNRPLQILWLNIFIRKEKRLENGKVVFKNPSPLKKE